MIDYYRTVMENLPSLSDEELDEVIGQATVQLKKNRKDVLIKASQKVLDALKEYDSIVAEWHPLYDDGYLTIR